MLAKLGVRYVIVGHSERRELFGETDDVVSKKVRAVFEASMVPILCVGETEQEREAGEAEGKVKRQVTAGLSGLSEELLVRLVIAYEPIWAIGTGRTASADDAGAMCGLVRATVRDANPSAAEEVRVLYGGSVNPGNIAGLMAKSDVDGGLVGGASLDPDSFASVVRYWV
jgi:triosephosphate isomerase